MKNGNSFFFEVIMHTQLFTNVSEKLNKEK